MTYTHLTSEERHYIETRHKLKDSTTAIALALGRSQSTVSRELRRNRGQRGYRHKQAHDKARQRHIDKPKAVKMAPRLMSHIDVQLKQPIRQRGISTLVEPVRPHRQHESKRLLG